MRGSKPLFVCKMRGQLESISYANCGFRLTISDASPTLESIPDAAAKLESISDAAAKLESIQDARGVGFDPLVNVSW
jgi:hypothetical protein